MLLGVGMTLSPHPPSIDIVLSDIKFRSINLSHSFEVVLYYTYVPPLGWIDNYAKIIQRKSDIKMWAPLIRLFYGTPGRDEPHLGLTKDNIPPVRPGAALAGRVEPGPRRVRQSRWPRAQQFIGGSILVPGELESRSWDATPVTHSHKNLVTRRV